jgi:hypothetical protein
MAEIRRFSGNARINFCANRRNCCIFFTAPKQKAAGIADGLVSMWN